MSDHQLMESHTKPNISQHSDPTNNISSIDRIMKAGHGITTNISNLLHLWQLISAPKREIQERELVKIFSLLVSFLNNLESEVSKGESTSPMNGDSTLWLPCFKACWASRSQQSARLISLAVSIATSRFPHSMASSNRVLVSWTKCKAICQNSMSTESLELSTTPSIRDWPLETLSAVSMQWYFGRGGWKFEWYEAFLHDCFSTAPVWSDTRSGQM